MELKTRKKLIIGVSMLVVGIALFSVGIAYSAPIVGLLGTGLTLFGGLDTFDYVRQGIKETVIYNKFFKQRDKKLVEREKSQEAEKSLVVSDFKKEEISSTNEKPVYETTQENIDTNTQDNQQSL